MDVGYPDMRSQPLLGSRNLVNAALVLLVPWPSILFAAWLFAWFPDGVVPADPGWGALSLSASLDTWAAFALHHPIATVNLLFLLNVDLLFWVIALAQRNAWLIDPYWTLIPPLIAAFYAFHPWADAFDLRAGLAWALLGVWSLRLTGNYFRREQWRFGFREDWRFARMRAESRHFWWTQLFIVWVAQHFMLVGLTLPFWAIHFRAAPFDWVDAGLLLAAAAGIVVAHFADTSLDAFMRENEVRVARDEPKIRLLESGLWRYSRHPNYFGEQLFWWALAGFGFVLGAPWVIAGTALNSTVLAAVTVMQERRMLEVPERRALYEAYRRRVSVWVPWFRRGPTAGAAGSGDARPPSDATA